MQSRLHTSKHGTKNIKKFSEYFLPPDFLGGIFYYPEFWKLFRRKSERFHHSKIQHINIEQKTIKSYANSKEELKNESEKL